MPMIMPTMAQAAIAAALASAIQPARDPATRLLAPLGSQAGHARPDHAGLPSPPAIRRAVLVDSSTGAYRN